VLLEKNRKRLAPGTAALARKVALGGPYCKWAGSPSCELRHGERPNHDWGPQNPQIQRASPSVLNKKQRGVFVVCCRLQLARGPEEAATSLGLPSSRTTTRPESPRPQEHSGWVRLCNCDGGPRGNTQWWRPETPAVRGARPPSPLRCGHRAPVDSQDLPGARRRRSRARLLPTPRAAARHRGRPSAGQRSRGRPAHQPPGSRGCRAARPVPNRRPLPSAPPFTAASSVCSACAATRPRKLTTAKASHAARS
jgi:hypothetical protein